MSNVAFLLNELSYALSSPQAQELQEYVRTNNKLSALQLLARYLSEAEFSEIWDYLVQQTLKSYILQEITVTDLIDVPETTKILFNHKGVLGLGSVMHLANKKVVFSANLPNMQLPENDFKEFSQVWIAKSR